jgi:HTH-type transcriptional regulator / antitoxin HigA
MSRAETSDILDELNLRPPKTVADYDRLLATVNALIVQVGDDESHPLAGFLAQIAEQIEEFEAQHIGELAEHPRPF